MKRTSTKNQKPGTINKNQTPDTINKNQSPNTINKNQTHTRVWRACLGLWVWMGLGNPLCAHTGPPTRQGHPKNCWTNHLLNRFGDCLVVWRGAFCGCAWALESPPVPTQAFQHDKEILKPVGPIMCQTVLGIFVFVWRASLGLWL